MAVEPMLQNASVARGELFPSGVPFQTDLNAQIDMLWHVLERAGVAVFWKDRECNFLGCNSVLYRTLGFESADEYIGKDDFDVFERDAAIAFRNIDQKVMESGIPLLDFHEPIKTVDGRTEMLNTSKMPVRNEAGEVVAMMGCFHVITEAVETERALRTLKDRFALAIDASRDGMWQLDLATDHLEFSPQFLELFELDQPTDQMLGEADAFRIFGPDFQRIKQRVYDPNLDTKGVSFDQALTMKDGSTRWFNVAGFPFKGADNELTHVIGTAVDVTEKIQREQELLYRANHDDLTELPNRRALHESVEDALELDLSFGLLYLDLDQFKLVNDSLGHQFGDDLLRSVAQRVDAELNEHQMLARLGGDEFAILAIGSSAGEVEEIAQHLNELLTTPVVIAGTEVYLTCSIGVVHCDGQYESAASIFRDADIALYRAKDDGRACFRVFEASMRDVADAALALQHGMHSAVQNKEFVLQYQPIVESSTGRICGVEALIRWKRPNGDFILPNAFLPFLEQTGLMLEVGDWVIEEGLRQLAQWRSEHHAAAKLQLSINLSRIQFRSDQLFDTIINSLNVHGIDPADLTVEVTETAMAEDTSAVTQTLERLREAGILVAMDDFGVGQSSLSALYDMPADIVKIDRAFVSRIEEGERDPLMDAVLEMARSAGLRTTAEGVETVGQRDYLEKAQCEFMQGFLLGEPMCPEVLAETYLS